MLKYFSWLFTVKILEFLEVKSMEMWELRLWGPGISHFHVCPHFASRSSSKLLLKCSYQPMTPVVGAPSNQILASSLQILGWWFDMQLQFPVWSTESS